MKESEPFINKSRGYWSIPDDFNQKNREIRDNFKVKLEGDDKIIECPKIFDGSEVTQTKLFKQKFLSHTLQDTTCVENPEEIDLEL